MSTALEIIQQAFATSTLNEAGVTAENAELIAILNELLPEYIGEGAAINDVFFAERVEIAFDDDEDVWPRPADAETILRLEAGAGVLTSDDLEIPVGTEIVDLPFDQGDTELGRPAVVSIGQKWTTAGRTSDPVVGTLVARAVLAPTLLADVDDDLPANWPSRVGNPCLKWELAIFLATKDGERDAEVAAFTGQRDRAKERYKRFLERERTTEVRTRGHGRSSSTQRITPQ